MNIIKKLISNIIKDKTREYQFEDNTLVVITKWIPNKEVFSKKVKAYYCTKRLKKEIEDNNICN